MTDGDGAWPGVDIPGHAVTASVAITIACECGWIGTDTDQAALAHKVIMHIVEAAKRRQRPRGAAS